MSCFVQHNSHNLLLICIFFSYILWPEHKMSNGACGVLEHYCSFCSSSITWCAMCVYACVCIPLVLLSCLCNFSHCLSPRIPWPVYTQLRAYWVWATCTNDWKHSRLKPGTNSPVLQVKSTNHWYTQPKMINVYFWNLADLDILMKTDFHETWYTYEWHCNNMSHFTMADNSLI